MSIDTDYSVLRTVLRDCNPTGWAIEFGVYSGASLAIIADHMPVIGLDSFDGLPEDWREGFPKGTFAKDEHDWSRIPIRPANAMVVEGLFEDTIPMLRERGLPQLGLVHIDCDLYSSTVTALEGVTGYIGPGTIIVFDEYHGYEGWEQHEHKAWKEFCEEYSIEFTTIAQGEQERAFRIDRIGA